MFFDVLTHDRPYKEAYRLEQAFQIVVQDRGIHFDPDVVDALTTIYHRAGRIRSWNSRTPSTRGGISSAKADA
jgi:HD-GYP domain-containing protein (c-di-GMP phosphodiesterase class II)